MQIRKATMNDLPDILAIYAYAREYMKEHGNPDQWKDNYPPLELTTQDIRSGCLHVCIIRANDREQIGGVFYFHPEEDPDYLNIDGSWLNSCPYAVVHRVATAPDTKGIATFCLNWALEQCGNIRIDTLGDNIVMDHLLDKNGFKYCGIVYVEDGTERIAYQKVV